MSTITSGNVSGVTNVVSPCVTTYDPNAFINVDSSLTQQVNITGIDEQFNVTLLEADSIKLLNGFTVSSFSVDCRLGHKDPNMPAGWGVSLNSADFKSMMEQVIDTATDASGEKVDQYLANQLRNAFKAAFIGYLPTKTFGPDSDGTAGVGSDSSQSASNGAPSGPATDANTTVGSVSVNLTTTVNGFKVDVLTDKAAAAQALIDKHAAVESSVKTIFRQSAWLSYLNDVSGWATTYLDTDALTMKKGDTLTFVFDMDVSTAGAEGGASDTNEDVPLSGVQAANGGWGKSEFALNLANRRVAFNIKLTDAASAKFEVGAGKLRVQPLASEPGISPGPGTNPASGANNGATQ
jgi:hypothetical protein